MYVKQFAPWFDSLNEQVNTLSLPCLPLLHEPVGSFTELLKADPTHQSIFKVSKHHKKNVAEDILDIAVC